jgi:hypothetical protein
LEVSEKVPIFADRYTNKYDVERFYAAESRAQACLGYAEAKKKSYEV